MAYEVRWTKKASGNLDRLSIYLEKEWGEKSVRKFFDRLSKFLMVVSEQPSVGKVEIEKSNLRSFVLTRQNTIFYRVKRDKIVIISLFDNRQNPESKKFD